MNKDIGFYELVEYESYSDKYVCITENVEYIMMTNLARREDCERTGWPKPEKHFYTHKSSVMDYKKAIDTFQKTHHGYEVISAEEFWKIYSIIPDKYRVFDKF